METKWLTDLSFPHTSQSLSAKIKWTPGFVYMPAETAEREREREREAGMCFPGINLFILICFECLVEREPGATRSVLFCQESRLLTAPAEFSQFIEMRLMSVAFQLLFQNKQLEEKKLRCFPPSFPFSTNCANLTQNFSQKRKVKC